jgi:hypothetical protein
MKYQTMRRPSKRLLAYPLVVFFMAVGGVLSLYKQKSGVISQQNAARQQLKAEVLQVMELPFEVLPPPDNTTFSTWAEWSDWAELHNTRVDAFQKNASRYQPALVDIYEESIKGQRFDRALEALSWLQGAQEKRWSQLFIAIDGAISNELTLVGNESEDTHQPNALTNLHRLVWLQGRVLDHWSNADQMRPELRDLLMQTVEKLPVAERSQLQPHQRRTAGRDNR